MCIAKEWLLGAGLLWLWLMLPVQLWRLELDHPGNSRGAVYGVNAEVSEGKIVPRQKINVDSYASKVLR
jgi:hypothetical protein